MKVIEMLREWLAGVRYRRRIHEIALHHHRAGVIAPYSVAAHEMFLRRKLEGFRDFASRRYLEDRSLTLDDIKQEWLVVVVKPMARSEFTRDDAKALKAAIVAITHNEAFVGAAKKAREADIREAIAIAKSSQVYRGRST